MINLDMPPLMRMAIVTVPEQGDSTSVSTTSSVVLITPSKLTNKATSTVAISIITEVITSTSMISLTMAALTLALISMTLDLAVVSTHSMRDLILDLIPCLATGDTTITIIIITTLMRTRTRTHRSNIKRT